jgi:hypothetical protein
MTNDDGTRPPAPPTPQAPPVRHAPKAPQGPSNTTPGPDSSRRLQLDPPKVGGSARTGEPEPLPVVEAIGPTPALPRITPFGKESRTESPWKRQPNTTGTGAVHVKTFHSKLTDDALAYLDETINEWLDAHPQYEVKFVTSAVGDVTGKLREPHLICQVWV